MKKRFIVLTVCFILAAAMIGCSKKETSNSGKEQATEGQKTEESGTAEVTTKPAEPEGEHIIQLEFTSELLSAVDNISPKKQLIIYLPETYYSSGKRFPVVYFFHGFGDNPSYVRNSKKQFDEYMQEGSEFIVVGVDGRTTGNNGSFYSNSPVTGPWEDYVIQEIVPYIDENYRTIAKAEARGAVGFSMGGYAAINLSMKHPDIFSSTLALCPGLMKDNDLSGAMTIWKGDGSFINCYGKTFAPNTENKNNCDIPTFDGSEEDNAIIEKWLDGFGHLEAKVEAYLALNQPLNKIKLLYATRDYYPWIPRGTERFSDILTENGIEHTIESFSGNHIIPSNFIDTHMVPFFSEALSFEE